MLITTRLISLNLNFLSKTWKHRNLMKTPTCLHDLMYDVKILRRKTGAGISLCMEALKKSNNDQNKAIDYIQEIFGNNKEEQIERIELDVKPGLVGITVNAQNNFALISKMNCQTDFTAKTTEFAKTFSEIMDMAARDIHKNYEFCPLEKVSFSYNDLKDTKHQLKNNNETVTIRNKLTMLSGQVKENLYLDDIIAVKIPETYYLGYYCHWNGMNLISSLPFTFLYGRIGSLAILTRNDLITPTSDEFIRSRARELAIHIVGMLPNKLELVDENELKESVTEDSYKNDIDERIDIDDFVGGALLEQPFFFRKSQKVRSWAMKNNILVVDYILME